MMAVSPPSRAQSAWMQPAVMPSTICSSSAGIVLRHGHVIEEEQRLGPAAQGVVDAHRHQVDAHRVVWHASRWATFSFVPTPSVQETSTGSS